MLSMSNAVEKPMSLDEFLAWEREQPERHEFDGYAITAMTGASLVLFRRGAWKNKIL